MNEKSEKLIVIGPSGSGKDHLLRKLVEKGLKPCLKCTTRPQRKFEEQGVTYNFITESSFTQLISEDKFLAYQTFLVTPENSHPETWYYGLTKEEFNNAQVFIMTPGELDRVTGDMRNQCFIVYLDISRSVRESRLFKREDKNDSISRRLDSDEIDFKGFKNYDMRISDPEFDADDIYDLMN